MLAYLYVILAVAVRVLAGNGTFATHGFTPVAASLLFFGSRMPRKHFWFPVALLIGSDFYLTLKVYGLSIGWGQGIIWAWYIGACFIGVLLQDKIKPLNVLGASVGSALSFFLVSNFAVWVAGTMYPMSWAGLIECYVKAIPFFRNELISAPLFSAVFFGLPVLYSYTSRITASKSAAA